MMTLMRQEIYGVRLKRIMYDTNASTRNFSVFILREAISVQSDTFLLDYLAFQ
jgi:hypothetical protein